MATLSSNPALPAEVTDEPPNYAGYLNARTSFTDSYLDKSDGTPIQYATYAAALAGLSGSTTDTSTGIGGMAVADKLGAAGTLTRVVAAHGKYTIRYMSATCYLHVYWDVVVRNDYAAGTPEDPSIVSTTPMDLEVTCPGNPCIPDGNPLALFASAEYAIEPTEPTDPVNAPIYNSRYETNVENLRWSCLADYTPPADGSANGFPL